MVNLLARGAPNDAWICVDAEPGGRVEGRLAGLAGLVGGRRFAPDGPIFDALEGELEELAVSPSRIAALALLEAIEALRRESGPRPRASGAAGSSREGGSTLPFAQAGGSSVYGGALPSDRRASLAGGDWLCHRPGRSLATGEAEIASRGYFDIEDRPPIGTWIALLVLSPCELAGGSAGRSPGGLRDGLPGGSPGASQDDALAIAAWVEAKDVPRARAGCRASPNGAVALLCEQAPEVYVHLRSIEALVSRR